MKIDESKDEPDDITDIEIDEAFEEFMLWSLSEDKYELTPKKFSKMAPRMATKLAEDDVSIEYIMCKRKCVLGDIEEQIQSIEFGEGINHLMTGMKFENGFSAKRAFKQQLEESVSRNKDKFSSVPLHAYVYDSFHEVISTWSSQIHLDDSLFFGISKAEFDKLFQSMVKDFVTSAYHFKSEENKIVIFEKYYLHPNARVESLEEGTYFAQDLLKSVLILFKEMHRCWRCERLHLEGEGSKTKALICAGCKCAVYCSRECQVMHWREGKHEECCGKTDRLWSAYESRKKRVGRALVKEKIFTKPITVDGKEKKCFLGPCPQVDYFVCRTVPKDIEYAAFKTLDIYYETIARLACGGKHPLFDDETISSKLEENIRIGYKAVLSEFDPKSVTEEEIMDMHLIAETLQYDENYFTKEDLMRCNDELSGDRLSIDRFIILYICFTTFNLGKGTMNKFSFELNLLEELKRAHKQD